MRFGDGLETRSIFGETSCRHREVGDVAGVLEFRECDDQGWTFTRAIASREALYLSIVNASGDYQHHEVISDGSTSSVEGCAAPTPVEVCGEIVAPSVAPALVGAWQRCSGSLSEESSSVACAEAPLSEFLVLGADNAAVWGCEAIDAAIDETGYVFRRCGGAGVESGYRGAVSTTSEGDADYLRIDDPYQRTGWHHFVRVDISVAQAGCPVVTEARCGELR